LEPGRQTEANSAGAENAHYLNIARDARHEVDCRLSHERRASNNGSMELPHPKKAARRVGLRYVSDAQPGIRRIRSGSAFRYVSQRGTPLRDSRILERIKSLAIPPAWENVWICPTVNGHLQATGADARGRKQYRYHPEWTRARNQVKFDVMLDFAQALPGIRRTIRRHMNLKGMSKEKVVACVVRLMDQALIRVGNNEYARDNNSYGLTTIRRTHVSVNGSAIRFRFKGKSGQRIEVTVEDPRAAKIVRKCQDLPGQEVFEYIDDAGRNRDLDSGHVNEYLYEISGARLTAKDFRTWGGTVIAATALHKCGPCRGKDGKPLSRREFKQRCADAVRAAAEALGNRVATCRKFYVHPRLAECYERGLLERAFRLSRRDNRPRELTSEERATLRLLKMMYGRKS